MKESKREKKVWMARDANGSLWLFFGSKPVRNDETGNYVADKFCKYLLWVNTYFKGKTDFPEVTNEGGPVEIELSITILKQ